MATSNGEPYQISESDWPFWIVPAPDGTWTVRSYITPEGTVLNGLTRDQAETLQVFLTELKNRYDIGDRRIAQQQETDGEDEKYPEGSPLGSATTRNIRL